MSEKKMSGIRAKIDYILKHNSIAYKSYRLIISNLMKFWGVFLPINKKIIVFTAHSRKYNDSPRVIYEHMIKQHRFKDFIYVWGVEDPENTSIPGPAIVIKTDTFRYFKYTLKARYWITCVNIERGLRYKKKGCTYLNTWHGVALKSIDAVDARDNDDFSYVDFMCYESDYQKRVLKRSFNAKEEHLIATGLPRNDELYHIDDAEVLEIKRELGLPLDKKVILYAPTWRDSKDGGNSYSINPPINIKRWESILKDNYVLLVRTHAYTNKLLGIQFNDFVRDVADYPSINKLFKISDILISDYSACIADYSILERPIICFAYDYDYYCTTRGVNIDFTKEMPSGVMRTEEEVINHIQGMDFEHESLRTRAFKMKYTGIGGHATEICIEKLFGNI